MNNKFYSILDLYEKFIFFLIFFFSLFFFRGRLGSDDLEVYNFVLAFKNSPLSFVDFIYFLKENYTSAKLNSEFFLIIINYLIIKLGIKDLFGFFKLT